MKRNIMSLAVAAALTAGFSGSALALPPSAYNTADTLDVYASGASAQDGGLEMMMRRVCKLGTPDPVTGLPRTLDLDSYVAANNAMYFCTIDPTQITLPTPAITKVVFHKYSIGGSGNGIGPVADTTKLLFLDMTKMTPGSYTPKPGSSPVVGVAGAPGDKGLPGYFVNNVIGTIAATTSLQIPDVGFSDVEPNLLGSSKAQDLKFAGTTFSVNAVILGVPVTLNLRNALQAVQGLAGEDEANMPSLTRQQIASLFAGGIGTWDLFSDRTGMTLPVPLDPNVYITRRVGTSGTQAGTSIYFLNYPCAAAVVPMLSAPVGSTCGTGGVYEGSGGGDVVSCLNTLHGQGKWSIGLLSTEVVAKSTDNWRFIKIDGHAPTLLNVAESKYQNFVEQSMQWNNQYLTIGSRPDKLAFVLALKTKLGDSVVVSAIDKGFAHTWGNSGLMALQTVGANIPTPPGTIPGSRLTAAQVLANPVLTMTKAYGGSTNNCQPPIITFPTGATGD